MSNTCALSMHLERHHLDIDDNFLCVVEDLISYKNKLEIFSNTV